MFNSFVKDGTTGDNGVKFDGHMSDEHYLTCKNIWNEFNMKNMADYYDDYLKKDVLLLADAFGEFTGLSWNAMLKMTGMELKKKKMRAIVLKKNFLN